MVDRDSLQGLSRDERRVVRSVEALESAGESPLPSEVVVETIEAFKRQMGGAVPFSQIDYATPCGALIEKEEAEMALPVWEDVIGSIVKKVEARGSECGWPDEYLAFVGCLSDFRSAAIVALLEEVRFGSLEINLRGYEVEPWIDSADQTFKIVCKRLPVGSEEGELEAKEELKSEPSARLPYQLVRTEGEPSLKGKLR